MLAPVSEAEVESDALLALGQRSLELYPDFVSDLQRRAGIDCRYRNEGTLWVASHRDDAEELAHLERTLTLRGLPVQRLDAGEVSEREPHLSPRVLGGLFVEDRQVDPRAMVRALERAIAALGGRIVSGVQLSRVLERDGRIVGARGCDLQGVPFDLAATDLVLAAGSWLGSEMSLPVAPPGIRPVKGQLLRLRGPKLIDHVVRTPDVYLIPRQDGELLVGATMEEMGFDDGPTAGATLDLLRHAFDVLPGTYDLELSEISVGLRPATEDHLPVIGPSEIRGLWYAAGHFRNGVLLAPATARYLAQWIQEGEMPTALEGFQPRGRDALVREEAR